MSMGSGASGSRADSVLACALGNNNGTYPNGTKGAGSWLFGHYVPTSAELTLCQEYHDPWAGTVKYGHWTIWFIICFVAFFSWTGSHRRIELTSRQVLTPSAVKASLIGVLLTKFRYLPPCGPLTLMIVFFAFTMGYVWGFRPCYRPPNFGSSPLGLRSEWAATATMPFIYAFGTRVNFVGYVTNKPLHTMRSFHVWAGWFCLFMSIVHTVAMFIRANRQAPLWYTMKTNAEYSNGFWALIPLIWLTLMSLDIVKNACYEVFYILHWLAASMFLAGMFFHCGNTLDSWAYCWATLALWAAALLLRHGVILFRTRLLTRLDSATVHVAGNRAVMISVRTRTRWTPGQHVYLRFVSLQSWATHPFTVASLPDDESGLVVLARAHTGMTGRLLARAQTSSAQTWTGRVIIDGPYGGETFLGVRLSFCAEVKLIWVVRQSDDLAWFAQEIRDVLDASDANKNLEVFVMLFISNTCPVSQESDSDMERKGERSEVGLYERCKPVYGRPNIGDLVRDVSSKTVGRLGIASCGPHSMLSDARAAAVATNLAVARNDKVCTVSEVEFYAESFEM
ncbi:hypothetical protein PUNSTDRAFT_146546 [Punctularia strigosozonata HHB-11173 SS5]|uniref:ferric-chelate reductase (NADPH) n=1 Tax=Punctularia strigosozonata (strain HHB-11173) TaxID=741275 RepID=R7S287_PUNST|nr:uncharacterized protein PUNSTDRAFT_146546 [Punctularia strigosozonata HHB-11173 SS5]EIN04308.1 hypothetical protein PUNSTDRAFT_146546 [Punctularia strigosozonata HHB-11173 SS5]